METVPEIFPPVSKSTLPEAQEEAHTDPPVTLHESVEDSPWTSVFGFAESEAAHAPTLTPKPFVLGTAGPLGWAAPVAQLAEPVPPDTASVIVTEAFFIPAEAYDFWSETVAPESDSSPLQERVYEPEPPETDEVQVTGCAM